MLNSLWLNFFVGKMFLEEKETSLVSIGKILSHFWMLELNIHIHDIHEIYMCVRVSISIPISKYICM